MAAWGCRALDSRHHVGLQQLVTLAAAARSLLGPAKRYKFVEEEEEGAMLVGSALRLLESLEPCCAAGQLLLETAQAQHRTFGMGVATLLQLAGSWGVAALECLGDGVPACDIVSVMSEGLESCLEVCRARSVTVREACSVAVGTKGEQGRGGHTPSCIPASLACVPTPAVSAQSEEREAAAGLGRKAKLRHSRHFSGKAETAQTGGSRDSACSHLTDCEGHDVARLATLLSHGSDTLMELVVEASRFQTEGVGRGAFDVGQLVTCLMPGLAEERSCVTPGALAYVSMEQALLVEDLKERDLRVCLFSGDLSENYRHLGFSRPLGLRRVTGGPSSSEPGGSTEWAGTVSRTLSELQVHVVLARGVASRPLSDACSRLGILVLEGVRPGVLKAVAKATGAVPVAYPVQVSDRCVGSAVRVSNWAAPTERGSRGCGPVPVSVRAGGATLVTAVIASVVHAELQALEDRFWGCAYRLHHALQDGRLLPGAGVTEMLCVTHLQSLAHSGACPPRSPELHRVAVLHRMASGWMHHVATLMHNMGRCSELEAWSLLGRGQEDGGPGLSEAAVRALEPSTSSGEEAQSSSVVFDNMTAKLEAWRRALDLVLTVLQTDMEIITGFSPAEPHATPAGVVLL